MLRLAVFDLDGTLKQERDPYLYLHRRLGKLAEVEASGLFARGFNGEISYETWLRLDAAFWRGTPRARLWQYFRENAYLPGARETIAALQAAGVEVAILSTGLLLHVEQVAEELSIRHYLGNEIGFVEEAGEWVVGEAVRVHLPLHGKGAALQALQARLDISPGETLAVGDTRGDIPLFEGAAVSVSVQPSHPEVAQAADIVLPEPDLRPLLSQVRDHAPGWCPVVITPTV